MPTPGDFGQPNYSRADPTKIAQYLTDVSDWAARHGARMHGNSDLRISLTDPDVWENLEFREDDTGDLYRYTGGGWHLWERTRRAFTPSWGGFTIGNGTQDASYSISNGRDLHLEFAVTLGSTSSFSTSPVLTMPDGITLITVSGAYRFPLGQALFWDKSAADLGDRYGVGTVATSTSVAFRPYSQGSTYIGTDPVNSTTPHTWASGDEFMGNIHSFIALQ